MKTIRGELFLTFGLFSIALVLSGILLNALFLERYYIYKNKSILAETALQISEAYVKDRRGVLPLMETIDRAEGINCTITDGEWIPRYNSFPQKQGPDSMRLPSEIEELASTEETTLIKEAIYAVVEKEGEQVPKLVYIRQLPGGELIILKKSVKGISESVAIANQFYLLAGALIIMVGGVSIYFLSGRITQPIIEMSAVAEEISQLNFSRRVVMNSQDELGSLAMSINRISEKLDGSINALKQDVERRKALVRNISHELKTPIGIVKGYAEGLSFGVAEDPENMRRYCRVITEECDRMDLMVRELLNLSMLEAGMFHMKKESLDIGELIRDSALQLQPILSEKAITLEVDCPDSLLISADRELMKRMVNNYLINGIHHAEGERQILVSAKTVGLGIRISVFNTGEQIPEEDREAIWDVFYKRDQARSRNYGGHGLGLSIVKQIAEVHGGSVGLENQVGGVGFYFEIPLG